MNQIKLEQALKQFFMEDIGDNDLSSDAIFSENDRGSGVIKAKQSGVFCGENVVKTAFSMLNPNLEVHMFVKDGHELTAGEEIAVIKGSIRSILQGERVVLNLLQRMSGIATLTKQAVLTLNSTHTKICDTRKTTPGLRMFEKYAVRIGGGYNHRFGLYDGVMIKDNHIAFCGSITKAVERVRNRVGHMVKIEVEVETEEQLKEAISVHPDIIMFDNCPPEQVKKFVGMTPPDIITEASGGITLKNLADYKDTNVDFISLGFITHSAPSIDISLSFSGRNEL